MPVSRHDPPPSFCMSARRSNGSPPAPRRSSSGCIRYGRTPIQSRTTRAASGRGSRLRRSSRPAASRPPSVQQPSAAAEIASAPLPWEPPDGFRKAPPCALTQAASEAMPRYGAEGGSSGRMSGQRDSARRTAVLPGRLPFNSLKPPRSRMARRPAMLRSRAPGPSGHSRSYSRAGAGTVSCSQPPAVQRQPLTVFVSASQLAGSNACACSPCRGAAAASRRTYSASANGAAVPFAAYSLFPLTRIPSGRSVVPALRTRSRVSRLTTVPASLESCKVSRILNHHPHGRADFPLG